MSFASPPTDAEHEAEVDKQLKIEGEVWPDPAPEPEVAPEVVVEEGTATIKSVNVEAYPIHVGLAGAPEEYTFTDESTTFEVPLTVAEQVTYIPVIEVVA